MSLFETGGYKNRKDPLPEAEGDRNEWEMDPVRHQFVANALAKSGGENSDPLFNEVKLKVTAFELVRRLVHKIRLVRKKWNDEEQYDKSAKLPGEDSVNNFIGQSNSLNPKKSNALYDSKNPQKRKPLIDWDNHPNVS